MQYIKTRRITVSDAVFLFFFSIQHTLLKNTQSQTFLAVDINIFIHYLMESRRKRNGRDSHWKRFKCFFFYQSQHCKNENMHMFLCECLPLSFEIFCVPPFHREVNAIDASVIPAQALSSAALFSPPAAPWPPNNHTPLFLFTICQRWRENWRVSVLQRERELGIVSIGFHMYWNQILIFFLFFKWEKVHCPTKGDFCGDLGKEELKWASGALLSPVDCV